MISLFGDGGEAAPVALKYRRDRRRKPSGRTPQERSETIEGAHQEALGIPACPPSAALSLLNGQRTRRWQHGCGRSGKPSGSSSPVWALGATGTAIR